jgi:hypothetical protein
VEVAEATAEDRPEAMALYTREPVRFRRSRDDWDALLDAGMLICQPGRLWIVRRGGRPVAYLASQPPGAEGSRRPGIAAIEEFAGDRWAIAEAAPTVARQMGAAAVELVGPDGDLPLAAEAAVRGWEVETARFPGTVGVLRPRELLAALAPWMEERLGSGTAARLRVHVGETETRFELEGEVLTLPTGGPLAALLFGGEPEEGVPPPGDRAPSGGVGALLQALFPLPLPVYGYNFI